ncbi:serine/threonine-protein kinase [Streptomyces sp. FZ201]|uniref:serine/threonine-protein kinase n=1 Tax=Streptomyces sp. FZ201 TaxID=3057122 RepID=UPI0021C04F95|nr:serine/threonine-protein kinase [Streptomyces sp. FZ201]
MHSGPSTSGVGRVIAGRYLLLHRLGGGGMGHVWLAHDQRLACEVALKEIVFPDPAEGPHEREARVARARAEARHAAGLRDHPHVVTVHDVLEHEELPWIVMEYVAGAVDLRDLVEQRGPLAPAECARVGLAVLDALTAGHERGVLHRDVKPANILLAPDRTGAPYGRVLLADYGISVRPATGETRWTMASALVGTPGYLAPERATGGPPTPAADLFSLGCTLYFGVEGQGPFARPSHLAELTAVVAEEPRPATRAGALGPIVHALLAKDPAARASAAQTEAALARIVVPQAAAYSRTQTDLGSQPQWAAAPPPPPPPHRAPRRRVLHSALAGLLGLALAGGGVWYAVAGPDGGTGSTGSTGSALPYGDQVGLAQELVAGDCVIATWPGAPFEGTPGLALDRSCTDLIPDGQVMAFVETASAREARERGAEMCEERTREVRERLADVRSFAVVPTDEGFEAAGRRTACLVLGAHAPVYGPLAGYRKVGALFADVATVQRRDCLDVAREGQVRLASCAGRYHQQVLGFTRMGEDVTYDEGKERAEDTCARDVPPQDYGFDPSVYEAGGWVSEGSWKSGTHLVVCTVRKQNGGTMEGDEP